MLRFSMILLAVVMLANSPMSFRAQNESGETSLPQATAVPAFTVIGPFVRTTNAVEMSGKDGKIGPLWGQVMHGGADAIPGVIDQNTIYAAYSDYENDETGAYDLILGRSVQPEEQVPVNMKALHIPAGHYLVFPVGNSSPDAIKAAWMNVYYYFAHHPERRAFTCDFEQHSSIGTRIFIAIK